MKKIEKKTSPIVIISPFQFRLQRGIERFSYSLADKFSDLGFEVIIYCRSKKNAKWGNSNSNVKYRILPNFKYFEAYWSLIFYRIWLFLDKPENIILNFLYHGEAYLPKKLNYTYVLNSPASQIPNRYEYIKNIIHKFNNLRFIAVSEMVKIEALPYINGHSITVIPNGVNTTYFIPIGEKKVKSKLSLITLAALEERKGIQYAIKALAEFGNRIPRSYEYHIFGDGPYFQQLKDLVCSLNIENSVFLHPSSTNALGELQAADIFILPSKGEAFALAPIEAMACGLPIIVSDYDPYPEFIKETFGKMVKRANGMEIIDAINAIDANYSEMSIEARKASLNYDWSKIASHYIELFH